MKGSSLQEVQKKASQQLLAQHTKIIKPKQDELESINDDDDSPNKRTVQDSLKIRTLP
jgi:hypothetical protein